MMKQMLVSASHCRLALRARAALCCFSLATCLVSANTSALQLRGTTMVYDETTNLTWVRDPSLAAGSDFDDGFSKTDGRMTYASAQGWVSQLSVVNSETGTTISDWRLPDVGGLATSTGHGELFNLLYGTLGNGPGHRPTNRGPFQQLPGSLALPNGFIWYGSLCDLQCRAHFSAISVSGGLLTVEGHLVGGAAVTLAWALLPSRPCATPTL
jgi:hypothetical protein